MSRIGACPERGLREYHPSYPGEMETTVETPAAELTRLLPRGSAPILERLSAPVAMAAALASIPFVNGKY